MRYLIALLLVGCVDLDSLSRDVSVSSATFAANPGTECATEFCGDDMATEKPAAAIRSDRPVVAAGHDLATVADLLICAPLGGPCGADVDCCPWANRIPQGSITCRDERCCVPAQSAYDLSGGSGDLCKRDADCCSGTSCVGGSCLWR